MRLPLLAATFFAFAAPALAQTTTPPPAGQQEMMVMMHRGARNQLGVLEYCQTQGFIGADVVALQQKMLGMLPPAQVTGLDEAEAAGKRGVVQFAGNEVAIVDAAKARNTTPEAMCKQMGEMLQSQAAQLPK